MPNNSTCTVDISQLLSAVVPINLLRGTSGDNATDPMIPSETPRQLNTIVPSTSNRGNDSNLGNDSFLRTTTSVTSGGDNTRCNPKRSSDNLYHDGDGESATRKKIRTAEQK